MLERQINDQQMNFFSQFETPPASRLASLILVWGKSGLWFGFFLPQLRLPLPVFPDQSFND